MFSLKHSNYDGRLFNAQANLIYRVSSKVGVGLGDRYDDYRIDATKNDFRGRVDYKFKARRLSSKSGSDPVPAVGIG